MEDFLKKISLRLLAYSMGVIFIWFGLLKVFGISPAEELIQKVTHWTQVHNFTIFLGVWEAAIGLCFCFHKLRFLGILLFAVHVPGTFLPLFLSPEDCFTHIPYGLTLEGQYIFKNLILISGVFILFSFRKEI